MATKDELGKRGEALACVWAERRGWRVGDRNWRGPGGEREVIAWDGDTLVAVEVKTRSSLAYGSPFEAITPVKIRRLRSLVGSWLAENEVRAQHVRIDALAVVWPSGRTPQVMHEAGVG